MVGGFSRGPEMRIDVYVDAGYRLLDCRWTLDDPEDVGEIHYFFDRPASADPSYFWLEFSKHGGPCE